ncbi:SGL domain-containing protein [Salix suchowensis]|nr:SGL domain-containing protein [Salix suchowensis]
MVGCCDVMSKEVTIEEATTEEGAAAVALWRERFGLWCLAITPHVIHFRSPGLYPESLTYDHSAQHFIVGSLDQRTVNSVSDAGVTETIISDPSLPPNASFLGLAVDKLNNRLFAVIHSFDSLHPFNGLASYDLQDGRSPIANDVALDFKGNAYVTNSAGNFIWKVSQEGEASIFSTSPVFKRFPVDRDSPLSSFGLNGIAYVSRGICWWCRPIRASCSRLMPMTARRGMFLMIAGEREWFMTKLTLTGRGILPRCGGERGGKGGRELFDIEEVRSEKESEDEKIWMYVLIGLGLTIFLIWRFQMKQLIRNMDKKVN